MVGFVPNCENISVCFIMEIEKNFLLKPQDLYFRNKRKLPRKKISTCDFYK